MAVTTRMAGSAPRRPSHLRPRQRTRRLGAGSAGKSAAAGITALGVVSLLVIVATAATVATPFYEHDSAWPGGGVAYADDGDAPAEQQVGAGGLQIAVMTDQESYVFGQTATITGNVSEKVSIEKPFFMVQDIVIRITGAGYDNTVRVYPDAGLQFATTVSLQPALGIAEGTYEVSATYADATAGTSFSVGYATPERSAARDNGVFVASDAPRYAPGQHVRITVTTQELAQFATFSIKVTDPGGTTIFSGNPVPVNGAVETSFLLSAVNPAYGNHTITAEYAGRTASHAFEVVPKIGGSAPIEISSDMQSYMPGDTATITGKLNAVWVSLLDVKIVQAGQGAITGKDAVSYAAYKIDDTAEVAGDGTFSYEFGIPADTEGPVDYKATFSSDAVSGGIVISVANDAGPSVSRDLPLTIRTDRQSYIQDDIVTFSGYITSVAMGATPEYAATATSTSVSITITDQDGDPVGFLANREHLKRTIIANEGMVSYTFAATPDESGRYGAEMRAHAQLFAEGNYTATASYMEHSGTVEFSVVAQKRVSDPELSTDKEVYGLGETVRLSGMLPATGANHVSITLAKPDGVTIQAAAPLEGQRFSWEWTAPKAERTLSMRDGELRGLKLSVFGVYRVTVSTDTHVGVAYFKLSKDPQNDSLAKDPLFVTTSKNTYQPGDDLVVSGEAMLYEQGGESLRAPPRVQVIVKDGSFPYKNIYESWLYPDNGGAFSTQFDLPIGVFKEGPYRVTASYGTAKSSVMFGMVNDYVAGSNDPIVMGVGTDGPTYEPGQTVTVTGGPNKIVYIKDYTISVHRMTGAEVDCGTVACGVHKGKTTKILPDSTASFTYQFAIPDGAGAVGTYEVTVESQVGIKRVTFEVVEPEPEPVSQEIIIQRQNRLPGSEFEIRTYGNPELVHEGRTVSAWPVSVTGSVVAPLGEEQNVNLRVSTEDGTCIIGQAVDCMISESAASRGKVYDVVQLGGGTSVTVVYNGAGERAERFSIFPEEEGQGRLPDMTWNVSIMKDDQASRFYYKATYLTSE